MTEPPVLTEPIPPGPYSIEVQEFGVWEEVDNIPDWPDTLAIASMLARNLGEDKIRISTADHQIL